MSVRRSLRSLLVDLRDIALFAADRVFARVLPAPREDANAVLVVRLDEIGDFVLWLDAAAALRRLFPGARIVLAGNEIWADLASRIPLFDEVIPIRVRALRTNPAYRFRLLKNLRRRGFGVVVHPVYFREKHFVDAESIVRTCGAVKRIGCEDNTDPTWRRRLGARAYTRLVRALPQVASQLRQNAEFVRELGQKEFTAGLPVLPPVGERPDGLPAGAYYVLCPGAGSPLRRWPVERFAEIARRIRELTGWSGVVCGSSSEKELGIELCERAGKNIFDGVGRTSVAQLVELIRGAKIVVSNETSAVHIATACNVPAVCVLGGGHYGRFLPYDRETAGAGRVPVPVICRMDCFQCEWRCIYPFVAGQAAPCVQSISLDDVWAAVKEVLEQFLQKKDAP